MTTTNVTSSQASAGLIESSTTKWSGSITYSVPGSSAVWQAGYQDGEPSDSDYGIFSTTQAANFTIAMELWDSYIAPAMNKVSDATPGDIRIAFTDVSARSPGAAAYAYYPPSGGELPVNGDIWVDETYKSSSFASRGADFEILLHEIGHALGLKHSFETPTLPAGFDNTTYTVMSYTTEDYFFTWSGGGGSISVSSLGTTAFTPMVLDILAIQTHYGADTATETGNTVYAFTDSELDGRQAIHDAGGTDTLDLSALSRGSHVDLRPGAYSDLAYYEVEDQIDDLAEEYGSGLEAFIRQQLTNDSRPAYEWERNLGVAFSTTIENAIGSSKVDSIIGNSAANRLDGRGGADRMEGLTGNDTYIVDNGDDVIVEGTGQGTSDTVLASVGYDLLDGVQVEKLGTTSASGTGSINLYGNALKQEITGNAGKNLLSDGGAGAADTLKGLGGDDTYRISNGDDVIVETSSQGANDTVLAKVTYDLQSGVFIEKLMAYDAGSTASLNLYGNSLSQEIIGSAGKNIISDGGSGSADTMKGLGGNDTYRVYNSGDVIVESSTQGTNDTVEANVNYAIGKGVHIETLKARDAGSTTALKLTGNEIRQTITGNAGANTLKGLGGDDTISGGDGDDFLHGGTGNDTLSGGVGIDKYVFDTTLNGTSNVDTITSFSSTDEFRLSAEIFTAIGALGTLLSAAFASNNSGNAGDTSDRIIFEKDTGEVYYDFNGSTSGGGVLFAIVDANLSLSNSDFIIV